MKYLHIICTTLLITACEGKDYVPPAKKEASTHSTDVSYNPDTCKDDTEGMVYFALERDVFRMPYQTSLRLRGMNKEARDKLPKRPDPGEPEGCPGNPMWTKAISLVYVHQPQNPEQYPEGMSFRVRRLSITNNRRRDDGSIYNALQSSNERAFEDNKTKFNHCSDYFGVFEGCKVKPNNPEKPEKDWAISLRAYPEKYTSPNGRPFVVVCLPYLSLGHQECYVSYIYSDELKIYYRLWLEDIPIKEIIPLDKGLRNWIEAVRVNDYSWSEE